MSVSGIQKKKTKNYNEWLLKQKKNRYKIEKQLGITVYHIFMDEINKQNTVLLLDLINLFIISTLIKAHLATQPSFA